LASKILVFQKIADDNDARHFFALKFIDNGDGTYSIFIDDRPDAGAPSIAEEINDDGQGLKPFPLPSDLVTLSGTGTSGNIAIFGPGATQIRDSSIGVIQLAFLDTANTFLSFIVATEYRVGSNKVVGAQQAAVADASGGATIDVEARTALNALLARLRTHGLIAT